MHRIRNARAFTLLELLVCVTVLGVLAMVMIPDVVTMRKNASEEAEATSAAVDGGYLETTPLVLLVLLAVGTYAWSLYARRRNTETSG